VSGDELNWRVEEACRAAWPSPREEVLEGWLLRAGGGAVRRVNSLNPLRGGPCDPGPVVAAVERAYAELGQPAIFRAPDIAAGMAARLSGLGYAAEGETRTLYCDSGATTGGGAELSPAASREWLQARARLSAAGAAESQRYEIILKLIEVPKMFAASRHEGEIAAIAYCVVHDGLAVIESVVTDPARRRRGHGRHAVASLMAWAWTAGAEAACLQVVADNAPAVSLYRALGFTREVYRYRYFRKTPG
jgi:ribosomal protein S18 acetylase RimI-like enzyme